MDEITRIQRRTTAYWFVDGIAETVAGLAVGTVGLLLHLAERTGEPVLALAAFAVLLGAPPPAARAVRVLKDGLTHRRTGYVRFARSAPRTRRRVTVAAVAVAVALVGMLVSGDRWLSDAYGAVVVAATGAAVAAGMTVRAVRTGMPRFGVVALLVAAATVVAATGGWGVEGGVGLVLLALGSATVATGAVTLLRYTASTRAVAPAAEDDVAGDGPAGDDVAGDGTGAGREGDR